MQTKRILKQDLILPVIYIIFVGISYIIIPSGARFTYSYLLLVTIISVIMIVFSRNNHKFLYYIAFLVLGTVMAFRAQTSIDDSQYRYIYLSAKNLNLIQYISNGSTELGYKILNYFLYQLFGDNYNNAQVVIAFGTFILWAVAIEQYKDKCSISLMTLFLVTHYYLLILGAGLVRIFIAIPIVLYGLSFLIKSDWKKYILCIAIASLFHISALFLLILIVFGIDNDWFYKNWTLFVFCMAVLIPIIFVIIAKIVVPMLGYGKYRIYANIGGLSLGIGSFDMLPIVVIGLVFYRYINDEIRKLYIISMVLLSLTVMISIYSSMVPVGRLVYYSNLGMIILIPLIKKSVHRIKGKTILIAGVILYAIVYMIYTGIYNNVLYDSICNYKTFFV